MKDEKCRSYLVCKAMSPPRLDGDWDGVAWQRAQVLEVGQFRPESSAHRPETRAKLLYDPQGLYVIFRVHDRYVVCRHSEYHSAVYKDSTVEFFFKPKADKAYFNFEINCGGTMLLSYNDGKGRLPDGSIDSTWIPWETASQVRVYHSMPAVVSPEIEEDVDWTIECFVPFRLLEEYVGPLGDVAEQEWRANFYKCADGCSHPHWASWSPVGGKLDFHQPQYFGQMRFEA